MVRETGVVGDGAQRFDLVIDGNAICDMNDMNESTRPKTFYVDERHLVAWKHIQYME